MGLYMAVSVVVMAASVSAPVSYASPFE